jgi:hypothetical protein
MLFQFLPYSIKYVYFNCWGIWGDNELTFKIVNILYHEEEKEINHEWWGVSKRGRWNYDDGF